MNENQTLNPLLGIRGQAKEKAYQISGKRKADLVLALLMLPFLLPLIGFLWLLARLDGGPGFYAHERIGRDGKTFRCWKVRSMVRDSQAVLAAHLHSDGAAAREWARTYKLERDPRVTRLGRILRKTSFDELPQIWNVLRGEMSLVGPRPVTRAELAKYRGYEWCYYSLRPGITGLWQVSGRNRVTYEERVQMDVAYLTSHSMIGDLGILVRTAVAVLGLTGR